MDRVAFVIMLAILGLTGCQHTTDPVGFGSLHGDYVGTFEVTFHDWQNTGVPSTQTGKISFSFQSGQYSYSGSIESATMPLDWSQIGDIGEYRASTFSIEMVDVANLVTTAWWEPSLYLSGTLKLLPPYSRGDLRIFGDTPMARYDIRLVPAAASRPAPHLRAG